MSAGVGYSSDIMKLVRRQLERFRGTEVKTMGDGFLATFDGSARAIACACVIRDTLRTYVQPF
jgi:class 3 adenylate cyclase